jgi:hypothetical protein
LKIPDVDRPHSNCQRASSPSRPSGLRGIDEPGGPFGQASAEGIHRSDEGGLVSLRGRRFPISYSVASVGGGRAAAYSYVVAFQDITQRLAAEEILRSRARES